MGALLWFARLGFVLSCLCLLVWLVGALLGWDCAFVLLVWWDGRGGHNAADKKGANQAYIMAHICDGHGDSHFASKSKGPLGKNVLLAVCGMIAVW